MQLLGGRDSAGSGGDEEGGYSREPAARPAAAPRPSAAQRPAPKSATGFDDMDDDIPF